MLTRETAIEKVNDFIKELIANGIPLERVILFGSYARNEQKDDSDIDVALFSNIFSGFGFEDKKLFAKFNIKKQYIDIETKTFSTNNKDPFIEVVENTGIELYKSKNK